MKIVLALGVCLAFLAATSVASDVVVATDDTFDEVIKSHDFVMVEFYAPWCGHCQRLDPEWEKAATEIKDKAVLAKVDCTEQKNTASKYEIKGFPTIKIFRGGEFASEYEGQRSASGIVSYVKSSSGPAVTAMSAPTELTTLKEENDVVVLGVGLADLKAFEKVASKQRNNYRFSSISSLEGEGANTIVMYKKFDEPRELFSGDVTNAATIESFLADNGMPLFQEINQNNYRKVVDRGLPLGWMFVKSGDNDAASEVAKKAGMEVAKTNKGFVSMLWVDANQYSGIAPKLGLKGETFPSFAIEKKGLHFAFDESKEITTEALEAFVDDVLAGAAKPTVKSQDPPAEHTVDGLTTVVGKTFEELVVESKEPVLVEFYAPWCGHCQKLAPVYKEVAKAAEGKPVRIAQLDADSNDFDRTRFPLEGFPTIFFQSSPTTTPERFEGGRDFDAFAKFLKEKTQLELTQ